MIEMGSDGKNVFQFTTPRFSNEPDIDSERLSTYVACQSFKSTILYNREKSM
jgi:hypothetical protein